MKMLYFLPILIGLTACTKDQFINIFDSIGDLIEWESASPPVRSYQLSTGKYPDSVTRTMMDEQYRQQQQIDKDMREQQEQMKRAQIEEQRRRQEALQKF